MIHINETARFKTIVFENHIIKIPITIPTAEEINLVANYHTPPKRLFLLEKSVRALSNSFLLKSGQKMSVK